jgi:hypothetical protein
MRQIVLPAMVLVALAFAVSAAGAVVVAPNDLAVPAGAYPSEDGSWTVTVHRQNAAGVSLPFDDPSPTRIQFIGTPGLLLSPCPQAPAGGVALEAPPLACLIAPAPEDTLHEAVSIRVRGVPYGVRTFLLSFTAAGEAADKQTSNPVKIVLARFGAAVTRVSAVVANIVLLLLLLGLLLWPGRKRKLTTGKLVNRLQEFVIEKATNSYSLSKVQLYIWLIAGSSAYLYLLLAHVMTQGEAALVDVPQSILAVAMISIGTAVAAVGVNSVAGDKGAGQFNPTPMDLVTSGGDVAPERVQQLLWTLIAAPAFVVFAYMSDPVTLHGIAEVPTYFLQLMGISSAGFVAGKVARGPGPKISSVAAATVSGPPPYMTLSVRGSDMQTVGITFTLRDLTDSAAEYMPLPAVVLPSSVIDSASKIATQLDLSLPAVGLRQAPSGGKWGYGLSVIASDGERADWEF